MAEYIQDSLFLASISILIANILNGMGFWNESLHLEMEVLKY
jgi:hypothetical protein